MLKSHKITLLNTNQTFEKRKCYCFVLLLFANVPVGSMGLIQFLSFRIKINHPCRYVGPMDPVLRFVESDFLRIVPWESTTIFTILGNYFWNFSPSIEHATPRNSSFFSMYKKTIHQQHGPQIAWNWKCISHFRHFHCSSHGSYC